MVSFNGKQKIAFNQRLGKSWQDLADYFGIPSTDQVRYESGNEGRGIWTWLEQRNKLSELEKALNYIDRADLILEILRRNDQQQTDQASIISTAPYPGLRAFTEDEAGLFFGREAETQTLTDKFSSNRFLAVIGASGSGKSSLVRAGLCPALKKSTIGHHWQWLRFTPGAFRDGPFMALANELFPVLEKAKLTRDEIAAQLQKRGNIDELAGKYLAQQSNVEQLVLFIDQFEELFTLVDDQYRQRFINLLERAVQSSAVRIVLTVRADFHEHCLRHAALAKLINSGAWHLASPDMMALWRIVHEPAKAAGLQFEPGLIEQILRDTGSGAGALALLAFALEQLYLACKSSTLLTWDAYDEMGGVHQAIGRHAKASYDVLNKDAQNALGEVFAELVTVDPERGVATRKRADLDRINQSQAAQQLIYAFTEARLLVKSEPSDQTHSRGKTIVEVAHEAVLTEWDLLKNWIAESFDDFCLLRQMRTEAAEWQRNGRPEANLWPHERLQTVYTMQQKLKPDLSDCVLAFIRPEAERLEEKLENPDLTHQQRERIGMRLAEIGDPRPGVGVDENGLPQIEWCAVPPGRINLENHTGTFEVGPFFIAKYPVTYRQYRAFLEAADGYRDARWWRDLEHRSEPGQQYRKVDNHPAEKVSWFDAMAFCRWLSAKQGYEIRLPTEWEWQQAATTGNPQNDYPWGETFDNHYCNTGESDLGRTTAVGLYPHGSSQIGAMDMSGNVWEWCLNCYDTPERIAISTGISQMVRGGSWYIFHGCARAAYRNVNVPVSRDFDQGFRLVCSSPIV